MRNTSSANRNTRVEEPRKFDWFMGLLYLLFAVGFIGIMLIFTMVL